MTVKELIKELKLYPKDTKVEFIVSNMGQYFKLETDDITFDKGENRLRIGY